MERMQKIIGVFMIASVLVSVLLVAIGGVLYLHHLGDVKVNYQSFQGQGLNFSGLLNFVRAAFAFNPQGLIMLGILILVLSQIIRVILTAGLFMVIKDTRFVLISLVVLLVVVGSCLS